MTQLAFDKLEVFSAAIDFAVHADGIASSFSGTTDDFRESHRQELEVPPCPWHAWHRMSAGPQAERAARAEAEAAAKQLYHENIKKKTAAARSTWGAVKKDLEGEEEKKAQ